MVITREIRDEIESAVNSAISKCMKNDTFIKEISNQVSLSVIKTIEQKLKIIENSVTELRQINEVKHQELESKIKKLEEKVINTEEEKKNIQMKMDQIDQSTRSTTLRIFNVSEKNKENTRKEVIDLLNKKMSIKLTDTDVKLCYRIGRMQDNKNRGIYLKLNSIATKQLIYTKKKQLKGTGIIIREDLTTSRVKVLNEAIEKFGLKNVWTENGKIHTYKNNKVLIIKNKEDLMKITV